LTPWRRCAGCTMHGDAAIGFAMKTEHFHFSVVFELVEYVVV
jgi:hypothetical protein